MPSKRQPSKQRQAAQNRARREALAARRENASLPPRSGQAGGSSSSGGTTSAGAGRRGFLGGLLGPGPGRAAGAQGGPVEVGGHPGRGALLVALVLSVGAAIAIVFLIKPKLDDRDEIVPTTGFAGLYLKAREALGGSAETTETTFLDAQGPGGLVIALLPAAVAIGAFLVYRARRARGASVYWPLTIAMVLMALTVMMGNVWAMPAMVAMAIASFQVRRLELPARMAERAAARDAAGRDDDDDDVIDVEEVDEDLEDEEYLDDAYEDEDELEGDELEGDEREDDEREDDEAPEPDPLADLEEEIAAEGGDDEKRRP